MDTGEEPRVREFFWGVLEMKYMRRMAGALAFVAAAVLTLSITAETAERTTVAGAQASNAPGDPGWP
ncbi:hypothetical protein RM704_29365 [Streptomyces sp. DSM 3412]|uniref:Uncharacterized protein n=1 Tax=Streptomyces gottesmaniae TaxID=3075518 RepID=A0ABU2Z4L4_9ACTN|nr:hypothetical protein [Streptomyces sp. DSM 3412]MDT0571523.1 hypothetical protein [Streptomyces sp. DSM 3412]